MTKIKISLTDFVDFVSKSGAPKLTKVKEVKKREKYNPAFDFWKPLRDKISDFHKKDKKDKNEFDKLILELTDKKKVGRYTELIKAYKSFLGKKRIKHFNVKSRLWVSNDLGVRVNPEMGLIINDKKYIIKFHFKADKLSTQKVEIILLLLRDMYRPEIEKGSTAAILDVPNKKLITSKTKIDLTPLLIGEANNFESIWNSI
jgi:hypothetical protein